MDSVAISVSFIVAIFGIAYPILFQVVSRLDQKYYSVLVLELFNKELEQKFFIGFLIASISSILIYILHLEPLIEINGLEFIINNSAVILVVTMTFCLIIFFFLFVQKILLYYTPTNFIKYLIKKHKLKFDPEYSHFKAISDILYTAIKEQNETIAKTVSDFLYGEFQKERQRNSETPVEYPIAFYELVFKSTEELASLKSKKMAFLEYRAAGCIWLLGEIRESKISEITYIWIWRILQLAIKYERDDLVMYYWRTAHQFYSNQLKRILPVSEGGEVINKDLIDERNKERKRFIEFQYALGGLLLYQQRYSCIKRMFKYTTSIPPKYELLPETMNEIFDQFIKFRDPYDEKFAWISNIYPFPDFEGLNADYSIKNWIVKYISVLFFRQYSIHPYLIISKPLELPATPETQSKKKLWLDNIDYFEKMVDSLIKDKTIINQLDLDFITDEWLESKGLEGPVTLINQYKVSLMADFEDVERNQVIDTTKLEEFNTSSASIINDKVTLYNSISNSTEIVEDYNSWYIYGERALIDKSPFTADQYSHHINYDSFLAGEIASRFQRGISETFFHAKSEQYLIKESDVFNAIDKLSITDSHLIIGFDQNLEWYKEYHLIDGLTEKSYNGFKLLHFAVSSYHLVGSSFFILKKEDLPQIIYRELEQEEIDKYSLTKIDDDINLYSSVIDLNLDDELLTELEPSHPEKELNKQVLINLALKTEIRWKKEIKMAMIKSHTEFIDRGVPDSINSVKSF